MVLPWGSKVRFAAYLLRDTTYEWWEVVGYGMGAFVIDAMT